MKIKLFILVLLFLFSSQLHAQNSFCDDIRTIANSMDGNFFDIRGSVYHIEGKSKKADQWRSLVQFTSLTMDTTHSGIIIENSEDDEFGTYYTLKYSYDVSGDSVTAKTAYANIKKAIKSCDLHWKDNFSDKTQYQIKKDDNYISLMLTKSGNEYYVVISFESD